MLTRRELLGFLGGSAAASLAGCWQGVASQSTQPSIQSSSEAVTLDPCVVKPQQSEGPFFIEERLNRSDIRSDPFDGLIRTGILLQLTFRVLQLRDRRCTPLSDAIVDLWHCDAEGRYSNADSLQGNTNEQQFLRGYQVTDAQGLAQFVTIFPGSYPGRAVHIHFKVRSDRTRSHQASNQLYEFTSQLYFDDAITAAVLERPPYAQGGAWTPNRRDGLFQGGGEQLLLDLEDSPEGFVGEFPIALEVDA